MLIISGTILQASSFSVGQMIAGRVITVCQLVFPQRILQRCLWRMYRALAMAWTPRQSQRGLRRPRKPSLVAGLSLRSCQLLPSESWLHIGWTMVSSMLTDRSCGAFPLVRIPAYFWIRFLTLDGSIPSDVCNNHCRCVVLPSGIAPMAL